VTVMTSVTTDVTAGVGRSDGADAHAWDRQVAVGPRQGVRSADQDGLSPDQTAMVPGRRGTVRSWPLLVLAAPAAVAVWSGWVGIGQMTGFGEIHPLPGIWDSLRLDTAVTPLIGVEAYAAFALRVWLTTSPVVTGQTRRFARRSALAALMLGMAGQVAYHLLAQAGVDRAPWEVTTVVACLPVLVLGMGSALAHLLRSDSAHYAIDHLELQSSDVKTRRYAPGPVAQAHVSPLGRPTPDTSARPPARVRVADVEAAVATVVASGQVVTRRSLRAAGLRGSNADLGMLAGRMRTQAYNSAPADS
jgi:hypothetical protein